MAKIKKFNEIYTLNLSFNSKEEFIKFWSDRWSGTKAEKFPEEFIERFPTDDDYSEFENDEYDYQDEDDEFDFSPEDEVYNIENEFDISIGDDITSDEWCDFHNSCWTWQNK